MWFDGCDLFPIGTALEVILSNSAMDGQRRSSGGFNHLSDLDRRDLASTAAQPDFGGHGDRTTCLDDALNDAADALGVAQEVRSAVRAFGDFLYRATEVEIDD